MNRADFFDVLNDIVRNREPVCLNGIQIKRFLITIKSQKLAIPSHQNLVIHVVLIVVITTITDGFASIISCVTTISSWKVKT